MEQITAGFHLSPQQKLLSHTPSLERAELVLLLEGPLDPARLHNTLQQLAEHHEILRTTYPRSTGMLAPFQVVNTAPEMETSLQSAGPDRHTLTVHLPALSADLASFPHLFHDLVSLYAGRPLAETLQYADYSEWHNELLQKTDAEALAGKNYWAERDRPGIPPLLLPFQKTQASATRESIAIALPDAPPDTLLAAWQILLWRLTGQTEVVIGRVIEGRNHDEFATGIGLYAKTVPEYVNFAGSPSFAEVIALTERSRGETALWEDYLPLAPQANALTVGFRFEEKPALQLAGDVAFSITRRSAYTPFAIELRCSPGAAELVYDPAQFTQVDMLRLGRRLALLLTADPQTPASALPLMDQEERTRILTEFNRTNAEPAPQECFHQLFETQAAKTPHAPALRFETTELTYAELNARANRIAHGLRARGIEANVPVGLLMERSADMIVALLGILKAGGCYVPLLPDYPKARVDRQIAETGAAVVLTQANLAEISLNQPSENPPLNTTPEDLVYIIYTSGSTGNPKGVAVTHANLVHYSSFIVKRLGAASLGTVQGWNFATVSTLSADLGNTSIFPALLSGGCLNVIGFETSMNAELYAATHPVDVLKITPSHLTTLLDAAGAAVLPRKFLISGGEALSFALLNRIREAGTCQVINHYGPTEATVGCCTFDTATDVTEYQPATVPIGRPIDHDEVYILDTHLEPVPVGTGGELCIGGAGIARGYFNQPEQTAERFVANPFRPGTHMYRTGDLARFLPTGDVEFLGRIDQQIKIRGFRVEPAEIEAALCRHPAIRQAAVIPNEEKVLVAYVIGTKKLQPAEWRAFLSDHLPEYMLPSRLVHIESLPLTPNGKVDTRALAALSTSDPEPAHEFTGPRNPEEEKMAAIWAEILKLPRVGIHDNFFELGGHSLLATQIIARVRNAFQVQLPLHSFLQTPTIAEVTAKLPNYPAIENEEDTLARLLLELDGISEEEAQILLATENKSS